MKRTRLLLYLIIMISLYGMSCSNDENTNSNLRHRFNYKAFVAQLKKQQQAQTPMDTLNVLESNNYDPFSDSFTTLLQSFSLWWQRDSARLVKQAELAQVLQNQDSLNRIAAYSDSLLAKQTDSNKSAELQNAVQLKFNLEAIRRLDTTRHAVSNCQQADCRVWARINKTQQKLYLYVEGELVDSFLVSTGIAKRKTPNMNVRASGPVFVKYTSKKFPGGNYKGLGNMPYAVFFRGGFAIHGTTPGNFKYLGRPASHGCVRLHPDDALIFNELVRTVGLHETWVTVE